MPRVYAYGTVDEAFVAELRRRLPQKGCVFWKEDKDDDSKDEIEDASKDKSLHAPSTPDVICYPTTIEEARRAVELCAMKRVIIVPRGSGTGVEGAAIPTKGGVVICTMKLRDFEIRPDDFMVVCGPGLFKTEVNKRLNKEGFLFGPDPASDPSVGGMCATGGSGMSTYRYGTTKENIVSLKVVTAQGKLIETRKQVRKSAAGFDLTQVFAGSEGLLGLIVECTFHIKPLLKYRCGALATYKNVRTATAAVVRVRKSAPATLTRLEMVNAEGVDAVNKHSKVSLPAKDTLFVECHGNDWNVLEQNMKVLEEQLTECGNMQTFTTAKGEEVDHLWEARRGCWYASFGVRRREDAKDRTKSIPTDICVPVSKMADVIAKTEKDFNDSGFPCIMCAHVIDGNFHCIVPFFNDEHKKLHEVETRMIDRTIAAGGTITGEHGVGLGKMEHMSKEHSPELLRLMRRVKEALDPDNIMNPGKVIPEPPHGISDNINPEEYKNARAML